MSKANVKVKAKMDDEFTKAVKNLGKSLQEWIDGMATMTLEQMLNGFFFNEHLGLCEQCRNADWKMPHDEKDVAGYVQAIHSVGYCGFGIYLEMNEVRRRTRD
jgi:hypothetical protein